MRVYEAAKVLDLTIKEVVEKIDDENITHRMHTVPESIIPTLGIVPEDMEETPVVEEEPEPVVEEAPVVVEEPEPLTSADVKLPSGVTQEKVWLSCRMLAEQSPYWKLREQGRPPKGFHGRS